MMAGMQRWFERHFLLAWVLCVLLSPLILAVLFLSIPFALMLMLLDIDPPDWW